MIIYILKNQLNLFSYFQMCFKCRSMQGFLYQSYQSWRQVETNWELKFQAPGMCGETIYDTAKTSARTLTQKKKIHLVTLKPTHISFSSKQHQQYTHMAYSYVQLHEQKPCARSAQVLLNNQRALPVSCGMNVSLKTKHERLTGCGCSAIQQLKHNQNSLMISSLKVLPCQCLQRV